jgi:transposase
LDTTPILGKGAVKDTYNLLAEGIEQLACRLAEGEGEAGAAWAERQGLSRYFGSSLKGEAAIDWDDKKQREQLLTAIVQDARWLLGLAEQAQAAHPQQAETIAAAAALLRRLIAQDVEEKPEGGCQIKPGTEKDRLVSVEDPEMRHGRKSASKRFNGHKAAVAVDLDRWSRSAGGQCRRPGESGGLSAPERAGDGSRGSRNGGRLCLRGRADAARLCPGRA